MIEGHHSASCLGAVGHRSLEQLVDPRIEQSIREEYHCSLLVCQPLGEQEAEVVAIGPGRLEEGKHVAPEVKKGDKVLIGKYSGTEVKIDGDEYLIMREDDILAIVD